MDSGASQQNDTDKQLKSLQKQPMSLNMLLNPPEDFAPQQRPLPMQRHYSVPGNSLIQQPQYFPVQHAGYKRSYSQTQQYQETSQDAAQRLLALDQRNVQVPQDVHNEPNIKLVIRQQPARARACGLGNSDRRAIDPPPVLQLVMFDQAGVRIENVSSNILNYYICHVSIMTEHASEDMNQLSLGKRSGTFRQADRTAYDMLTGSRVASVHQLKDLDGSNGQFYIFNDLSIRSEGAYRLCFRLVNVLHTGAVSGQTVVSKVISDVFNVYTAKRFPGMKESSELMKCFAKQGIKVTIRKEFQRPFGKSMSATDSGENGAFEQLQGGVSDVEQEEANHDRQLTPHDSLADQSQIKPFPLQILQQQSQEEEK